MDTHMISGSLDKNAMIVQFSDPSGITGYAAEDVVARNWFDIFIKDVDKQEMLEVFSSFFYADIAHWSYDNRIVCKNGIQRLFNFKNQIINNPDGKIELIAFTAKEVDYAFLSVEHI